MVHWHAGVCPGYVTRHAHVHCPGPLFTHSRLEEARTELVSRAQLMADQLAPALEFDLISGDRHHMRKLLDQITLSPMVQAVEIKDAFGASILRRESDQYRQQQTANPALPVIPRKIGYSPNPDPAGLGFDVFR